MNIHDIDRLIAIVMVILITIFPILVKFAGVTLLLVIIVHFYSSERKRRHALKKEKENTFLLAQSKLPLGKREEYLQKGIIITLKLGDKQCASFVPLQA